MTRFPIQLECPTADLVPGEPLRCRLRIYNPADAVDEYTVVGHDAAAGWVATDPPSLTLLPETDGELELTLTIPPEAPVHAGEHRLVLRISSSLEGVASQTEDLLVRVAEVSGIDLRILPPAEGAADGDATATVAVANTGNHPLDLVFSATDHEHGLSPHVQPWELAAEPFEAYTLGLVVPLSACSTFPAHRHRIEVTAIAEGRVRRSAQVSVDHEARGVDPGPRSWSRWLRDTVRLFVAVPLAAILVGALEVVGAIVLLGRFGLRAVAVAVAASLVGAALVAYHHGALHDLRAARREGATVEDRVADAATRQLAGILLLLPGLVTGLAGAAVLLPGVRRAVGGRIRARPPER